MILRLCFSDGKEMLLALPTATPEWLEYYDVPADRWVRFLFAGVVGNEVVYREV